MRLIDADALIEKIRSIWRMESEPEHKSVTWKCAMADAVILVLSVIAKMLPIDAEPVRHGEWISMVFTDTGKSAGYKCSECGLGAKKKFAYCHCGAKMDGGDPHD